MRGDRTRAGEDEMIEGKGCKGRADFGAAGDDRKFVLAEAGRNQLLHELGGMRGIFRWLHDCAISGCEDGGERREDKTDRKIPRADDPDYALGLKLDMRLCAQQAE